MKYSFLFIILFLLFSNLDAQHAKKSFKKINQIEGRWKMKTSKGFIMEEWIIKNHKIIIGKSYLVKNEKDTVVLETLKLIRTKDGVFYIPTVMDQNNKQPVYFKLILLQENKFVFENKEHDFPQRIIYDFKDPDNLHARIEGVKNGEQKNSDFFYQRIK